MTAVQEVLDTDELLHVALAAMKGEQDAAALDALKRLLAQDPGNVAGQHLLGAQYAHLEMYDRAETVWTHLLTQDPGLDIVRLQLSQLLMSTGKHQGARASLQPLLAADGAMAWYAGAVAAALDGDVEATRSALRQGLASEQPSPAVTVDMQHWLQRLSDVQGDTALSAAPGPGMPPVESNTLFLSRYRQQE